MKGVLVGYARTSTVDQEAGLDAQVRDLAAAGCDKVFREQVSATGRRQRLEDVLDFIREGDTLVVTKPDRLARSVADLLAIVAKVQAKRAGLRVLSMGGGPVDLTAPTGRLVLTMLGAIAEFERALMLERQREGIAAAKERGAYKGRVPTAQRQRGAIEKLRDAGHGPSAIARELGISRSSVYRVLDEGQGNDGNGEAAGGVAGGKPHDRPDERRGGRAAGRARGA
jgi:DNA invertase Pin-like site-specific DNA recombinase